MNPLLNLLTLARSDETIVFLTVPESPEVRGELYVQIAPHTEKLDTPISVSRQTISEVMDNLYRIESNGAPTLRLLTRFLATRRDYPELVAAIVPDDLWGVYLSDRSLALHNVYTEVGDPTPGGLADAQVPVRLNDERELVLVTKFPLTAYARFVLEDLADVDDSTGEVTVRDSNNTTVAIETVIESDQIGELITNAAKKMQGFELPVVTENEVVMFAARGTAKGRRPAKSDDDF